MSNDAILDIAVDRKSEVWENISTHGIESLRFEGLENGLCWIAAGWCICCPVEGPAAVCGRLTVSCSDMHGACKCCEEMPEAPTLLLAAAVAAQSTSAAKKKHILLPKPSDDGLSVSREQLRMAIAMLKASKVELVSSSVVDDQILFVQARRIELREEHSSLDVNFVPSTQVSPETAKRARKGTNCASFVVKSWS